MNSRRKTIIFAIAAIAVVWLLATAGFLVARNSKVTAEKLRAYLDGMDLSKLSGDARAKALRDLAKKLNSLSTEERRQARADRLWSKWFEQMTDQERGEFIDATLPSGFKQMVDSFEKMPEEKRRKAVNDAVKRMKEARASGEMASPLSRSTNGPVLSDDLQKKVAAIGLKSVYGDSSAQTKAELAPFMEEIQKSMESGRLFRGP